MSELSAVDAALPMNQVTGSVQFQAEMANGLHALAQPLTVLRGIIEVLRLPQPQGGDPGRYLNIASTEIERSCRLFECVQDLLATQLVSPRNESFEWWDRIALLVDQQTARLQKLGISVSVTRRSPWLPVCGDAQRAERAITAALWAAGELARSGETIELIVDAPAAANQLTISNPHARDRSVSSSARLQLALARESAFSQGGEFRFDKNPFCISLALPVDRSAPRPMAAVDETNQRSQLQ